jgi:hypothetical protein
MKVESLNPDFLSLRDPFAHSVAAKFVSRTYSKVDFTIPAQRDMARNALVALNGDLDSSGTRGMDGSGFDW